MDVNGFSTIRNCELQINSSPRLLYVPIQKIGLISRYGGLDGDNAPLTKLGTKQWETTKRKAIEKTYGKKPIPTRGGGSIPIVALFETELGLKSVLMGFGLDSDNIHSPDEHYGVFNFMKGIETIPLFFKYFAEGK